MPIEIMELVIKAKVEDEQGSQAGSNTPSPNGGNPQQDAVLKTIENAVQEVLEIVKRKNER